MTEKYTVEYRFHGQDFNPENLNPKEVADLLVIISEMITDIVLHKFTALRLDKGETVLGLYSITQASLDYTFVTTRYVQEVEVANDIMQDAVVRQNYDQLPVPAIEKLIKIRSFDKMHGVVTEVSGRNGTVAQLTTISPDTRIQYDASVLRGVTTVYGTLIRIGGDDPPRALIQFMNGQRVSCMVASVALARNMAHRLYERIGVTGIAQWYTRDMTIREFRINDLLPYRQVPLSEALTSLRDVAGDAYGRIEDIPAHIADIRGKDEDEL